MLGLALVITVAAFILFPEREGRECGDHSDRCRCKENTEEPSENEPPLVTIRKGMNFEDNEARTR